ncbi:MAG: 16S rRNA (uracil(1498)-N(3))-methyltransferase [Bacteroidales bacterium]
MQLFYIHSISGNTCILSEEESWHSIKVLRLSEGNLLDLTDGAGNFYRGTLTQAHHKKCVVEISDARYIQPAPHHLHIAIAPTKNIDRFEWFLEKSTEIGINEITPLWCEHSEREVVKPERLEKVLVAAMKQSLRSWLPSLNTPVKFTDFIHREYKGQKFIGYCETGNESALHDIYQPGSDVLILIGPEGDFSKKEIEFSANAGFTPISLGESRLRTETAGVVACHTIGLMNAMKKA